MSIEAPATFAHAEKRLPAGELTLLLAVFVIAACGLLYELAAGALASYLLGDSILRFSTVIGSYLFAMGLGSYASRFIERELVAHFLRIELLVGLVGGLMPTGLFALHSSLPLQAGIAFEIALYACVSLIGILVGLEIPLVMRILKRHFNARYALKDLISQVLTFDYLGALVVSVAFPLWLVPQLGLVRAGLFFGLLNSVVAIWALYMFRASIRSLAAHAWSCLVVIGMLFGALLYADQITSWAEDRFYGGHIVFNVHTPYQQIVITAQPQVGTRLFLNGNLQFHSRDEYRYHEALVHPAMAAHGAPKKVLILGGGDGMAAREVLKYPSVKQVVLVELDSRMTALFRAQPLLTRLNEQALSSAKLTIINADAFKWLDAQSDYFDIIIIDFPDPTNFSVGKLYTTTFYTLVEQHLNAGGFAVIQTTSPLIARQSFWTVARTLEAVGLQIAPYHAHVPSFGEWGFIVASHRPWAAPQQLPPHLKFLNRSTLALMFDFPPDMARVPALPNRLSNQVLVQTFAQEWGQVRQ